MTLGEDRSRVRTGHAPLNLAHSRNFVIAFAHRLGTDSIAATLRAHLFHPLVPLNRLLRPQFTFPDRNNGETVHMGCGRKCQFRLRVPGKGRQVRLVASAVAGVEISE